MIYEVNGFQFDNARVTAVETLTVNEARGERMTTTIQHVIDGEITLSAVGGEQATVALNQSALSSSVETMINAMAVNGFESFMLHEDGAVGFMSLFNSSDLIGKTKVKSVSFPAGLPNNYVTEIAFRATLEGTYLDPLFNSFGGLVSYEETVTIESDGGPTIAILQPIEGPAIFQQTTERTHFQIRQTGSAVGS